MHVFVTGASGVLGSAVVKELLAHGHTVVGLARNEASAQKIKDAGAEVHLGSITDLESLKTGAAKADGVVHLAFNPDFTRMADSCKEDGATIDALGSVLVGTGKPLVVTSTVGVFIGHRDPSSSEPSAEDAPAATSFEQFPRIQSELSAFAFADKDVRVSVVRLPPTVHGPGDHGFVPRLIQMAREQGDAAYVGDGENLWPACHKDDAAAVYRLALERGSAGSVYHAMGETGIRFKDIAAVVGKKLDLPVKNIAADEADTHFGWFKHVLAANMPVSSEKTKAALGWEPKEIGLLEDMETGTYFA